MYLSKACIMDHFLINKLNNFKFSSNAYFMHQLIRSLFPDSYKGPLLFRSINDNKRYTFYIVSTSEPILNKSIQIHSKKYTPCIEKGQILHFSLTANPAIVKKIENKKNGTRYDIWMDTRKKEKEKGISTENVFLKCYENTKEWLIYRSNKYGFNIRNIDIERYTHHSFTKTNDKNKVSYGAVDYRGLIEITDPEIFVNEALFKGIGPSKAFGCGLMLVKKA